MASDEKQLQIVLQAQAERENDPSITTQVILEMKSSLIFQISWPDLLQAGPTSLNSLGACFAATTNPKAAIILKPPTQGYTYLKYESVKANLIECGNLGRFAFIEAESGMGLVQQMGAVMNGKMNDILRIIGDPLAAQKMLRPQLHTISSGADQCLEAVKRIDKKFEDWLLFACELHAACVAHEQETHDALISSETCVAAEQTRLDLSKSSANDAKKTAQLLEKQVSMAGDAFKTASDKFPTGWDIMGQQVVGDIAHCVTTALNAAIPAIIDTVNPMKKLKAAGDVVGSFVNPKAAGDKLGGKSEAEDDAPPPPRPRPSPVPKESTDPAYAEVISVMTYMSGLKGIIFGIDGDVDWDRAKGDGTSAGAKASISFILDMLKDEVMRFAHVATSNAPSESLTTILDTCVKIASEITSEVEKSREASHSLPEKTSDTVKQWQTKFTVQYERANQLAATGRTLPGSTAGGVPIVSSGEVQVAETQAKTTQAQAVLDSAKNRLETTQAMLTTSQDNYIKANELLLEQQNRLADIQSNLQKLTAKNLTLKEVKGILISCIKLIINLKQNITDLLRFFNAFTVIIQVAVKTHVEPFLSTVSSIVTNGSSEKELIKVANYSMLDLERTMVYSAVVTIRSYFGVFSDIAKMWVELSANNIIPGLKICDECAMSVDENPDTSAQKLRSLISKLERWSRDASERVSQIAGEKQKQMLNGMQERIDDVQATTAQLPPAPPAIKKAIESGAKTTEKAAVQYLEEKKKQSGLDRFANIDPDI